MMQYKRRLFLNSTVSKLLKILLLSAVLVLGIKTFWKFYDSPAAPIRIGAILALSGTGSHLVDLRDAMVMAAEEINSGGGVNNRKIELIIEDSQSSPSEAEKTFLNLEKQQPPLLYISTLSSVGMTLAPLAMEQQVVLMGLVTTAPEFADQGKWVFRNYINTREEVRVAQKILDTLQVREIGIIHLDDPYGNSMAKMLSRSVKDRGGVVTEASFANAVEDLTSQIEKVRASQAVYLVGLVKHLSLAIRQLRGTGYGGYLVASSGAANPEVTKMSEADGVYVGIPLSYNKDFPFARQFKEKFTSRFNKPFSHQAANGYDAVKMIAGLLESSEDITRAKVRSLLAQGFLYSGVQGNYELKAGSQEITVPLYPGRIDQGNLRFLLL